MKLFFDPTQTAHRPAQFMVRGRIVAPLENPDRADALVDSLGQAGLALTEPTDAGLAPILAVHADHYVDFLAQAYDLFQALPDPGPEVLPNVHAYVSSGADFAPRDPPKTTGIIGRAGWYVGDLACAIMAGTWRASLASAQTAVSAADDVAAGARASFALCRPPGHHAYIDRASGFCFFNNAAIAAQRLRASFARVAILDFDTHHGDGTQAIFYRRNDVFVGSAHTDPRAYYPYFTGYEDETGAGEGSGFNLNIPLADGSDDEAFVAAVGRIAIAATAFGAEALVVSAGWDAHASDPLSTLSVTTAAYGRIGTMLGALGLPTVIVQEGGYSLAAVREAAPSFVAAFAEAHG